jgi:ABC-type lipoprotein export system ATPase subunit
MNDEIHLANIISGTSNPQFVVGIFGKWGSGKTTLMGMIKKELLDKASNTILTVCLMRGVMKDKSIWLLFPFPCYGSIISLPLVYHVFV